MPGPKKHFLFKHKAGPSLGPRDQAESWRALSPSPPMEAADRKKSRAGVRVRHAAELQAPSPPADMSPFPPPSGLALGIKSGALSLGVGTVRGLETLTGACGPPTWDCLTLFQNKRKPVGQGPSLARYSLPCRRGRSCQLPVSLGKGGKEGCLAAAWTEG